MIVTLPTLANEAGLKVLKCLHGFKKYFKNYHPDKRIELRNIPQKEKIYMNKF